MTLTFSGIDLLLNGLSDDGLKTLCDEFNESFTLVVAICRLANLIL